MNKEEFNKNWRNSRQYLLPEEKPMCKEGNYDIYPSFKVADQQIFEGFESLASYLVKYKTVKIDGYDGVFYEHFRKNLENIFINRGIRTSWINTSDFLKPPDIIEAMVSPFTGGDDPIFGKRTDLGIEDFLEIKRLKKVSPDSSADINFIIGPGASLVEWSGLLLYIDLPKNEIQFRSRAGSITNLGASEPADPKSMYKRFYFVDWVVLNKHKQNILQDIDLVIDAQRPEKPVWMRGEEMRKSFSFMSQSVFRVRPWFEPGIWGGTWIKEHIEGLNKDVPNYAWSFELIVPENGLLFESSGKLLEVSFDFLMYSEGKSILGDCYDRFCTTFPIRFDFLDTFDGGNLSVQCHPQPDYIKTRFGEDFTQEETYYILDTKDDASVFLGFKDNIDPLCFRNTLEKSHQNSEPVDIDQFVQRHPSSKHDLFLIPFGTIHGSGKNNLVLEISSTPYIFTFKMYDWLRPDLDGKPRPLNIKRGMDNLNFEYKGVSVVENLISKPVLIDSGEDWQQFHLPTHKTQLYDVHRFHFRSMIEQKTNNKCHVFSLVEGTSILVETVNGYSKQFSYAETFVIPAAAGCYRIFNKSSSPAIIVKAFVK